MQRFRVQQRWCRGSAEVCRCRCRDGAEVVVKEVMQERRCRGGAKEVQRWCRGADDEVQR